MQPSRSQPRAPGSFSPLPTSGNSSNTTHAQQAPSRAPPRRVDSSGSGNVNKDLPPIVIPRHRHDGPPTPIYAQFATQGSAPHHNLHQNYSRPAGTRLVSHGQQSSPRAHSRKHSATQGLFEPTLPSTSTFNLSPVGHNHNGPETSPTTLSASQIAAQAAVLSHQSHQHARQRSQTVPFPGEGIDAARRGSNNRGPLSPPVLSLTEASGPRESGFGIGGPQTTGGGGYFGTQHYSNNHHPIPNRDQDRLGSFHSSAATAAANVVFPRSGRSSPNVSSTASSSTALASASMMPPPPVPSQATAATPLLPDKLSKSEKAKAKLFSRPGRINTKAETRDRPLPSPGKIGHALSALQRGNFSTSSLVEPSSQTFYSMNNSSSATIRPIDASVEDRGKEKEKKHHFLSRQRQKLKDEYHLPLSSAASNSKPTDPSAPSSLYNFSIPASPGPHPGGLIKGKKERKLVERSESRLDGEIIGSHAERPALGAAPSFTQQSSMYDPVDPSKLGLQNHMALDDAWPYLMAKLLVIFEGEDLRLPVEDFNRVVQMYIQYHVQKRSPAGVFDDLRGLLVTGFSCLDRTLRNTPEDRFVPSLVELWVFTFTSILPYMQSVFLPLDLEVAGKGAVMSSESARDFWGGIMTTAPGKEDKPAKIAEASAILDVRRLVLTAYRDVVILPRYDTLKTMFSRLSLDFIPSSLAPGSSPLDVSLASLSSDAFPPVPRPGTAMSVDPSVGSYNSNSTTLLGDGSAGGRSRAISNVSFGSHASDGAVRPFTPQALGSVREQNVEDSKFVTDMVGRMLQCMSVLSSLGGVGDANDGGLQMIELCKMLKLNWLGRGRTGRNRRGIVGGRVKREDVREEVRVI